MAGIYIHVPFCKTRCVYCDFFTKTNNNLKDDYLSALLLEIELRQDYLGFEDIDTIYFGGGTPSLLSPKEIQFILNRIYANFNVVKHPEITIEANPDDLNEEYLGALINLGINRLSIGIQSFNDSFLHFLGRRHSAQKAIEAIHFAKKHGFRNISIDLIYGLPKQGLEDWERSLDIAISLEIQHISAYHLIYEQGTRLYRMLDTKKVSPINENLSVDMFSLLMNKLKEADFIHYEISNFGKENYFSLHNSSYWLGKKYLGLGPSAHSYNIKERSWNASSITQYVKIITNRVLTFEREFLDINTRYNDFVITGLRTMWGVNKDFLQREFGDRFVSYFMKNIEKHLKSKAVLFENSCYKLSLSGIFISDSIMSDLMYV